MALSLRTQLIGAFLLIAVIAAGLSALVTRRAMARPLRRLAKLRHQLAVDIAHDLRTPLTVIAGYVEAMEEGDLEPTTARLRLVSAEVKQLREMVSDLSLLSQGDAGELLSWSARRRHTATARRATE